MKEHFLSICARKFTEDRANFRNRYEKPNGRLKFFGLIGFEATIFLLPLSTIFRITIDKTKNSQKPELQHLCLLADNLPISWGKIVKTSAADYEDRINELWGAGKYRSAKWNQKLAWLCALSNLGHYLWLKAWKPLSTVFRRLL